MHTGDVDYVCLLDRTVHGTMYVTTGDIAMNIKDMPEAEFIERFGGDRELIAQMMVGIRHSPFPDRPMLPQTKMSGSGGEAPPLDYLERYAGLIPTKEYKSSNGCAYGMQSVELKPDGSIHFVKSIMRG